MLPRVDRPYWLRNCLRFGVEAPDRRLGTVADVGFGADGEPAVLIVRAGLFRRRVGHVPVDQIETIIPEEERIILHRSPRILWQNEERAREEAAPAETLPAPVPPGVPGAEETAAPKAPPVQPAGSCVRSSAPGREATPSLSGERPAEVSLTLEEAKAAIRAAGGDVIQVGFLARAYRRQREEEPDSEATAAARERLRELLATRLKDRKLLAPGGRFELLEEPPAH